MQKIAIIIPCYNEEKRLQATEIDALVALTSADIYFADDGSNDGTLSILKQVSALHSERCFVIQYPENEGKAETVYKSVNHLLDKNHYTFIGYFDADFSTPPSEIQRLAASLKDQRDFFLMGSRVKLLNTNIARKTHRHIIGRVIVTIINLKFSLGIYDTQCGAKFFSASLAKAAFDKPFVTSWLFDVELFVRLKKRNLLHFGQELPLLEWRDVDGSKLSWKTAFKIAKELLLLHKNY